MRTFNGDTYDPLREEVLTLLAKYPGRVYSNEVRAMALELQEHRARANGPNVIGIDYSAFTP